MNFSINQPKNKDVDRLKMKVFLLCTSNCDRTSHHIKYGANRLINYNYCLLVLSVY